MVAVCVMVRLVEFGLPGCLLEGVSGEGPDAVGAPLEGR